MSVTNQSLRIAVAAAIAGAAATSANATSISSYSTNATAGNNVNVFISGSTALDNTLTNAAIQTASGQNGLCAANSADIYLISSTNKLIYCQANSSTLPTLSGKFIAIFKESQVGSANGVQPLINVAKGVSAGTNFINPTAISDSACGSATVASTTDEGSYVNHPSCPSTATVAGTPIGGFADVEAAILLTAAGSPISATDTSTYLTAAPTLDQVWGVAVTKTMYYALQTAEGLTCPANYTQYGSVVTGTTFLGKDSPSCAPSLSRQQVASILTTSVGTGTTLGIPAAAGHDDNIYLCRRDYGSGTEASFEAYFVGQRCGKTSLAVPGEDGAFIWAAASGGGVRTCLQAFNNGGVTLTGYYDTGASITPAGTQYAIGFTNTEITKSNLSSAGDAFRLIAVDGVMPQLANVQDGTYPYFSTGNAYTIKAGKTGAPSGNAATVFTKLQTLIGHPIWTADSNSSYSSNPWGVAGDMSPAGLYASSNPPTLPASHTSVASNPTNAYTKTFSGSINNCDQPVFDSQDLTATTPEGIVLGTSNVNN